MPSQTDYLPIPVLMRRSSFLPVANKTCTCSSNLPGADPTCMHQTPRSLTMVSVCSVENSRKSIQNSGLSSGKSSKATPRKLRHEFQAAYSRFQMNPSRIRSRVVDAPFFLGPVHISHCSVGTAHHRFPRRPIATGKFHKHIRQSQLFHIHNSYLSSSDYNYGGCSRRPCAK